MDYYPSKKKLRNSGLLFSSVFAVLFLIIPFVKQEHPHYFSWIFSFGVLLLSIISPSKLRIPYIYWIKLGGKLSKINLIIILTIIFYIIITPLSIIRNLFKLAFKPKKKNSSFYKKFNNPQKNNFHEQL